jgi:hypothetical protein
MQSIILLGGEEELRANEALGRVLLLGIVSATEHYFRAVLAGLVHTCPLVRKQAASLTLSFGALDYYSKSDLGFALLEHVSLATAGEIQRQTQKLLGIDVNKDSSTSAALLEYEKLCQFRHAAVHARGELGHENLHQLGVQATAGRLALRVEFASFHSSAAICQNVVRSYNRLIYRKTVERWMAERVLEGSWAEDRDKLSSLFKLFYSIQDSPIRRTAYQSYLSLLPTLRRVVSGALKP